MQKKKKEIISGNSLAVQWLGPGAFTAEDLGSIPGQGTKIPQAAQPKIITIGLPWWRSG